MQIAVVEIPTDDTRGDAGLLTGTIDGSEAPVSAEPSRYRPSASGLWARAGVVTESSSTQPNSRRGRSSGVFPAVSDASEFSSANDVWRWVPPSGLDSPEGCLRLVVFQRGASWPPCLARDLSGGVTTCIVPEVVGDGLSGLVQRVAKRASQVELPVTQLIWITGESRRTAPLRFIRQLAEAVDAGATVVVVQAQAVGAPRRRHGRRRRPSDDGAPDSDLGSWAASAAASA